MKRILEKILKIIMVWKAQQVTTNYKCCTSVSGKKKKKKATPNTIKIFSLMWKMHQRVYFCWNEER